MMPMREDYQIFRRLIGTRLSFSYDTGAQIVGVLTRCLPEEGAVELVVMKDAEIISSNGTILERHSEFSFVPNLQTFFKEVR